MKTGHGKSLHTRRRLPNYALLSQNRLGVFTKKGITKYWESGQFDLDLTAFAELNLKTVTDHRGTTYCKSITERWWCIDWQRTCMVRNYTVSQEEGQVFGYTCERKGCDLFFWRVWFLHVLVELLPAALVLQTGLGQVDREHTGDSYHACNPSIDQFGWEAV